jgi:HEAT repeat protein
VTGDGPVARAAELASLGRAGRLTPDDTERAERALAADPDARVRAAALGALVRAGDPVNASRAWTMAVGDQQAAVRRRAAELGAVLTPSPAVARALVVLLDDRDVTVVEAAAWALGELADHSVVVGATTALARVACEHRDPLAREAAVAALGALGDPAGLPAVLAGCNDRPAIRRRAVLALAPFEGEEVDAAVARALVDRDWQVRQAAEDLTLSPSRFGVSG